jgi:hypothetical protein
VGLGRLIVQILLEVVRCPWNVKLLDWEPTLGMTRVVDHLDVRCPAFDLLDPGKVGRRGQVVPCCSRRERDD